MGRDHFLVKSDSVVLRVTHLLTPGGPGEWGSLLSEGIRGVLRKRDAC